MPTISKENPAVTLINIFTMEPRDQETVVGLLREATEKTMKHLPGFVSASIHRSIDGKRVANYAQWRSQQDFDAMTRNPEAQAHMKPLLEIAQADFHLYQVSDTFEMQLANAARPVYP